jgi:uncharacterized protein YndB with AHSA1/START domain
MARVERLIVINAPVDKVFARIEDNERFPEWWPNMVEQRRQTPGQLVVGSKSTFTHSSQLKGSVTTGQRISACAIIRA